MEHIPVLLQECINGLNIKPGGIYIDGTLGRGGHAAEIAKKLTDGRLIAIDRDKEALIESESLLSEYKSSITLIHGNFGDIKNILEKEDINKADGMLFDLGVSSPQLDDVNRGFSYKNDAVLDMRMDPNEPLTAFEAVNTWQEEKLRKTFYEYGEERYSKPIARAIINKRAKAPIDTTFKLNDVIKSAIPAAARREPGHPSKRCFQALRIAVNGELGSISSMLDIAPSLLKPEGRLCVISFHSLEDRLVKRAFTAGAKGCICSKEMPVCVCGNKPVLRLITSKPVTAGTDEIRRNPRAKSAKLRIAERI